MTSTAFRRIAGFVTQEDVFEGCLTVEETLRFKAALLLSTMKAKDRLERVEEVISALQLHSCASTHIGDDSNPYMKGISGGEKRRLAIAIEILDPNKSILIADEPTSGLDAASAQAVANLLRSFADRGMIVLTTLHQPRNSIMHKFDSLMIMASGRAIYYGKVKEYTQYLTDTLKLEIQLHESPYDLLLDVLNPAIADTIASTSRIKELSTNQDESVAEILCNILYNRNGWSDNSYLPVSKCLSATADDKTSDISVSHWLYVVGVLFHRTAVIKLRDPICLMTQIASAVLMGIIYGVLYYKVYDKSTVTFSILDAQMAIAMTVLMAVWLPYDVTLTFPKERRIFLRERKAGLYTTSSFFVARITADMPAHIISAIIIAVIVWAMAELNISPGAFILIVCLGILIGASVMQLIGAVSRTFEEANIYMMVVLMMSMMLGTGFVRETPYFLKWARSISIMGKTSPYIFTPHICAHNLFYNAGITSDLAMYREFRDVPAKYGSAQDIFSEYGVLIRSEDEMWKGVLVLFYIWLICRFLTYVAVKFCFTGRTFAEDLRD